MRGAAPWPGVREGALGQAIDPIPPSTRGGPPVRAPPPRAGNHNGPSKPMFASGGVGTQRTQRGPHLHVAEECVAGGHPRFSRKSGRGGLVLLLVSRVWGDSWPLYGANAASCAHFHDVKTYTGSRHCTWAGRCAEGTRVQRDALMWLLPTAVMRAAAVTGRALLS